MATQSSVPSSTSVSRTGAPKANPCILVIFGASGDLTKRLLMPALYNLACDGLLSPNFALVGFGRSEMSAEQFRAKMTEDIKTFSTRSRFDGPAWEDLSKRFYFSSGEYGDPGAYQRLVALLRKLDGEYHAEGNILVYMATPPALFEEISRQVFETGIMKREKGWTRIIVEKPFGHDLPSAIELSRSMSAYWTEDQIYRIDHYLGKETVQNLVMFRFANGIFEPLWNKNHIDHIQFTVDETVGVEGRGSYYDRNGVLRDMIQNHMFQMLAYLCMEPPGSFQADEIRNEKVKLLRAVRLMTPEDVLQHTIRGQYGPGRKADGKPAVGYREEPGVPPQSSTETYAAVRLFIDNWRWEGVPIYLRSGKALWKRGTEIVVQFRKAPEVLFRHTPAVRSLEPNRLVFHMQPDQGIELRFHAKTPGPTTSLQKVSMRFDYKETFEAQRGTGYEVLLYDCMMGDQTLFSRTDFVETAWRIAQPILDTWAANPPKDFPNYPAGTWGPKSAFDFLAKDGRRWLEVINRSNLEQVALFNCCNAVLLHTLAMALRPVVYDAGSYIIRKGEMGQEMYVLARGQVEVLDGSGTRLSTLEPGDFFGELSLLHAQPRTANVRAVTPCDLFVLDKADFTKALLDFPQFAASLEEAARTRYQPPTKVD
jgi:glucose-6-phosphate 1-dehydrogenase